MLVFKCIKCGVVSPHDKKCFHCGSKEKKKVNIPHIPADKKKKKRFSGRIIRIGI